MNPVPKLVPGSPPGVTEGEKQRIDFQQIYKRIGEQYEAFLAGPDLVRLDSTAVLDRDTILRLALVTVFQYAEALTDPEAEAATLARKDWKQALHLPARHPGLSISALCQFRGHLSRSNQALQQFQRLLDNLESTGLSRGDAGAREVVLVVCMITRLFYLKQAMKMALSFLVSNQPDWLRTHARPHWYREYPWGAGSKTGRASIDAMQQEAARIGRDFQYLLQALDTQELSGVSHRAEMQLIVRLKRNEFQAGAGPVQWLPPDCATCTYRALGLARSYLTP